MLKHTDLELAEEKENFLRLLEAHILVAGGDISRDRLREMSLGKVLDSIYSSYLRLEVKNLRLVDREALEM